MPNLPEDFLDYDRLLNDIYCNIAGMIKLNHIFSVSGDDPLPVMELQERNLSEHPILKHILSKRGKRLRGVAELKSKSDTLFLLMKCLG
jgi:hypothetical protein